MSLLHQQPTQTLTSPGSPEMVFLGTDIEVAGKTAGIEPPLDMVEITALSDLLMQQCTADRDRVFAALVEGCRYDIVMAPHRSDAANKLNPTTDRAVSLHGLYKSLLASKAKEIADAKEAQERRFY